MDDWERLETELLENPATRLEFERLRPAFELASRLLELRTALGLSQRQVAARAGITQPEVARLESGDIAPTWETVSRVLAALGAQLELKATDVAGKRIKLVLSPGAEAKKPRSRKAS